MDRCTWIGESEAAEKISLTVRDDVLGFPVFEIETAHCSHMEFRYYYALTEQGFVYGGEVFGYDFDDMAWGDGAWPVDLDGDGRSELVTRSTYGDGASSVDVYRYNAEAGVSQKSYISWKKANAEIA